MPSFSEVICCNFLSQITARQSGRYPPPYLSTKVFKTKDIRGCFLCLKYKRPGMVGPFALFISLRIADQGIKYASYMPFVLFRLQVLGLDKVSTLRTRLLRQNGNKLLRLKNVATRSLYRERYGFCICIGCYRRRSAAASTKSHPANDQEASH